MRKDGFHSFVTSLFLAAAVVLTACSTEAEAPKAPDFSLLDLKDKTVSLSDFSGKVVFINFFATYCPPCRMEIPDFVKLQERYRDKGFVVLGISVDQDWERVLPFFVKAIGINFPVLRATPKVLKDYGDIFALPTSFLIGRDGRIIKEFKGMVTESELEPLVTKALSER